MITRARLRFSMHSPSLIFHAYRAVKLSSPWLVPKACFAGAGDGIAAATGTYPSPGRLSGRLLEMLDVEAPVYSLITVTANGKHTADILSDI